MSMSSSSSAGGAGSGSFDAAGLPAAAGALEEAAGAEAAGALLPPKLKNDEMSLPLRAFAKYLAQ